MRLLRKDEIEVKVKQISDKGSVWLLYKTARVDMTILDEEFGAMNWQSDYKVVNENLYCGIGVKNESEWVWKWDCGVESREDGDGNEKKGEASDAFKRAGFKWGIGRELYNAPFIWISSQNIQTEGKFLKDKFTKLHVEELEYNDDRTFKKLTLCDQNGKIVYAYPDKPQNAPQSQKNASIDDIINAINEKMTYENEKAYYARAMEVFPKGTAEYKLWKEAWKEKHDQNEHEANMKVLEDASDFLNNL